MTTQNSSASRQPESPTTFPVAAILSAVSMDCCPPGARDWTTSPLPTGGGGGRGGVGGRWGAVACVGDAPVGALGAELLRTSGFPHCGQNRASSAANPQVVHTTSSSDCRVPSRTRLRREPGELCLQDLRTYHQPSCRRARSMCRELMAHGHLASVRNAALIWQVASQPGALALDSVDSMRPTVLVSERRTGAS